MSLQNPLDKPGTPFHVELLYPNPTARRGKEGPVYRVSFEIDQPTFQLFIEGQSSVRLYAKMAVIGDDEKGVAEVMAPTPEKAQEGAKAGKRTAKEKGPHSAFSGRLFALGFFNHPGIKALIHKWCKTYDADTAAEAIYQAFGVTSRTEISPDTWRGVLEREFDRSYPLRSAMDIIKEAEEQAGKVANVQS